MSSLELMSPATVSTPLASRALALGLEGSRVMPRILNSLAVWGSLRMDLMTEPPWLPVAPKTTTIFLLAMSVVIDRESFLFPLFCGPASSFSGR